MAPLKSSNPASSVPNITELRRQLQHGTGRTTFSDDVNQFRRSYRTASGLPGVDLYNWNSPQHQESLDEMTDAYLEKEGRGNLYWPDDENSINLNVLQYSRDHSKIKTLMKQLWFRLNQQQFRNHKYKGKDKFTVDRNYQQGQSVTDPINVEASNARAENPFGSHPGVWPSFSSTERSGTPEHSGLSSVITRNEISTGNVPSKGPGSKISTADVYTVPLSPELLPSVKQRRIMTLHFPSRRTEPSAPSTPNFKRPAHSQEFTPQELLSKRARRSHVESSNEGLPSQPSFAAESSSMANTTRVSTRGRRIERKLNPEYATDEQIRAAIGSPAPTDSEHEHLAEHQNKSQTLASEDRIHSSIEDSAQAAGTPTTEQHQQIQTEVGIESDTVNREESRRTSPPAESTVHHNDAVPSAVAPPTPAEEPHDTDVPSRQPTPESSTLLPKPLINFAYHITFSRIPILRTERWQPKGKFQDKSLADVYEELKLDQKVIGLVFTLEGPGISSKDQIGQGDEANFDVMKKHFNKQIKACVASHGGGNKPLLFEFEIEPLKHDEQTKEMGEEEADIEW